MSAEDRLLKLLLERSPAARRELERLAEGDPAAAAEIARLSAWLGRAQAAALAEAPAPARERALVDRVLAATTRLDPSWRGDLSLYVAFVRRRMRASPLVRAVAAALLVNLGLLPVATVAWLLVREPEPEPHVVFRVEPAPEPAFADLEPEEGLAPAELPLPVPPAAADVENRLRRARWLLDPRHGAVPAPAAEPAPDGAPREIRLLDLRARLCAGEPWPEELDREPWDRAEGAELALLVELALDRYAREGERAPRLEPALDRLARRVAEGVGGAAAALQRMALDRAIRYGLFAGRPSGGPADPLDPAWRAALAEALGPLAWDPRAAGWVEGG